MYEERSRLKWSKTKLGDLAGVSGTTVGNWERGVGSPDAVRLSQLAEAGFDVMYVLSGAHRPAAEQQTASYQADRGSAEAADDSGQMSMPAAHAAAQDAISNNRPGVPFRPDALRAVLLDVIVNSKHYGHKWTTEQFIGIVVEMYEKYAQELSEGSGVILTDDDGRNESTGTHG